MVKKRLNKNFKIDEDVKSSSQSSEIFKSQNKDYTSKVKLYFNNSLALFISAACVILFFIGLCMYINEASSLYSRNISACDDLMKDGGYIKEKIDNLNYKPAATLHATVNLTNIEIIKICLELKKLLNTSADFSKEKAKLSSLIGERYRANQEKLDDYIQYHLPDDLILSYLKNIKLHEDTQGFQCIDGIRCKIKNYVSKIVKIKRLSEANAEANVIGKIQRAITNIETHNYFASLELLKSIDNNSEFFQKTLKVLNGKGQSIQAIDEIINGTLTNE